MPLVPSHVAERKLQQSICFDNLLFLQEHLKQSRSPKDMSILTAIENKKIAHVQDQAT